jgi:hypothetical protein
MASRMQRPETEHRVGVVPNVVEVIRQMDLAEGDNPVTYDPDAGLTLVAVVDDRRVVDYVIVDDEGKRHDTFRMQMMDPRGGKDGGGGHGSEGGGPYKCYQCGSLWPGNDQCWEVPCEAGTV